MLPVLVVLVVVVVVLVVTARVTTARVTTAPETTTAPEPTTAQEPPRARHAAARTIAASAPGVRVYAPRRALVLTMRFTNTNGGIERLGVAEYLSGNLVVETPDAMADVAITRGGDVKAYLAAERTCVVWHEGALVAVAVLHLVRNGKLLVTTSDGAVYEREEAFDDGTCRWAIARGAWGGPCCVSRSALSFEDGTRVAFALPDKTDAFARQIVQPFHEVGPLLGTRWRKPGCTVSEQTGGEVCRSVCSVCDSWHVAAQLPCSAVASNGWCAVRGVRDRCTLSCAMYLGTRPDVELGSDEARVVAVGGDVVFAKTPPRVAMYFAEQEPARVPRAAGTSELTRAVRNQRWRHGGVTQDPAVSMLNSTVADWSKLDRQHFWRVLTAMDTGRLSENDDSQGLGACVHMNTEVTGTRRSPYAWREREQALDAKTCSTACETTTQGRRNLNYYSLLGLCAERPAWKDRSQPTRSDNAAHDIADYFGARMQDLRSIIVGTQSEESIRTFVDGLKLLNGAQKKRLYALHARDYDDLTWDEVTKMFGLNKEELAVLKAAVVAPVHRVVATKNEWTVLSAKQRLALVGEWNKLALVRFHVPSDVGAQKTHSRQTLDGPGRGVRLPSQNTSKSKFKKFYALWPTDRLTRTACVRCRPNAGGRPPVHDARICSGTELKTSDMTANAPLEFHEDGTTYLLKGQSLTSGYTVEAHCLNADRNDGIGKFPWEPFVPYAVPLEDTGLYNDCVASVELPPGFACYVTPHVHSYHMSEKSCMSGLAYLRGTPGAEHNGHEHQCRVSGWLPQFEDKSAAPVGERPEPVGIVLINDDLATRWVVSAGDVLSNRDMDASAKGDVKLRFPYVVNCIAAWNYYAEPSVWVQRSHDDANAGDKQPLFDAVAGATNNVRATSTSLVAFIEYHKSSSVNVWTIMRSNNAEQVVTDAKKP
jgi:hypothetical protein